MNALYGRLLSSFLLPLLKDIAADLVAAITPEISAAAAEAATQAMSNDGWTHAEKIAYVKERLLHVRGEQIGNELTDKFVDFLIDFALRRLGSEPAPEPQPAPDPNAFPYGEVLSTPPDRNKLVSGNAIYKFDNRAAWITFKVKMSIGVPNLTLIEIIT